MAQSDLFSAPPAPRRIAYVYVSQARGVVVTFDQHSREMAHYTGSWEQLREAIMRDAPPGVQIL